MVGGARPPQASRPEGNAIVSNRRVLSIYNRPSFLNSCQTPGRGVSQGCYNFPLRNTQVAARSIALLGAGNTQEARSVGLAAKRQCLRWDGEDLARSDGFLSQQRP